MATSVREVKCKECKSHLGTIERRGNWVEPLSWGKRGRKPRFAGKRLSCGHCGGQVQEKVVSRR